MGFFRIIWNAALMIFGGIFLLGGIFNIGDNNQAAIFGIIVSAALFLWRFIPEIIRRKREKAEKLEAEKTKELIQKEKDERPWTCSHCGANTQGKRCEYCDSPRE